jgi:stage III sporulation protein AF
LQAVYGWVITIVAAVLIFNISDILMPSGGVKRVSRAVIGVIVVAMIISPIAGFLGGDNLGDRIPKYEGVFSGSDFNITYDKKSYQEHIWEVYIRNNENIDNNKE